MCPYSSPIWSPRRKAARESTTVTKPRSFVASSKNLMDICSHPDIVPLHGVLSGKDPHVTDLYPLFSLSKTAMHADILGIPVEQFAADSLYIPFDEKPMDKLMWRGSNTGTHYSQKTAWKTTQRIRLVELATTATGSLEVLLPGKKMLESKRDRTSRSIQEEWKTLQDWGMDISFTGKPIRKSFHFCENRISCLSRDS